MSQFRMPALGADMEWGVVTDWLKQPGDVVHRGDIIAVVETQKGAIEIEVFEDGVLEAIKVSEGTRVPVGEVLAVIGDLNETPAVSEPEQSVADQPVHAPVLEAAAATPPKPSERAESEALNPIIAGGARLRITPAARREAARRGLDLGALQPGRDGIIGLAQFDQAPDAQQAQSKGLDRDDMRKVIGAAMARSKREIPHYYVTHTIDVTLLMDWLRIQNENRTVARRLLYAVPLIKAVAVALVETPDLNGHFEDGMFQHSEHVHIGVATALRGGGLIAPAIHDADHLDLDALMEKLRDLVSRVRSGRLRSSEMMDPTVTLSNLGEETVDAMLPVIYPPQVAIIGCGAIAERPWVVDGVIVPRKLMAISVSGNHRVSDGRVASRFLSRLDRVLQTPEAL
jgi:pyruvate dehydrogenase E2 component (dihydrolipoamide acetyltransferase)